MVTLGFRGEWPNGLRHCNQIPSSNPIRCSAGLGTQLRYKAPSKLMQWLTSGEWWWWWWWWIVFVAWLTDERLLALFPTGTIVRDPHHRESLTCCVQDLNLCRTWVQTLLNEVVQTLLNEVVHGKLGCPKFAMGQSLPTSS